MSTEATATFLITGCIVFVMVFLIALATSRSPEERQDEQTDERE